MAKSDNLLAILSLLSSRSRMTAAQIARELEVDVRTVYRYIDALSMSGAPIIAEPGPNGGYGLLESFREVPLFFTLPERTALAHAALFARQSGYPYSNDLSKALTKIDRQLSPDQLEDLHRHTSGLDVIGWSAGDEVYLYGDGEASWPGEEPPDETGAGRHLKAIEQAVTEGMRLKISHFREIASPPVARRVDPYGLVYWHGNWYLVGYCHLREDIRMFRCDRIVEIESTGERFTKPPGFSTREEFLKVMLPREAAAEEVTIRLRGTPYALDSLSRHWFLGNFVRERNGDEIGLAVDLESASLHLPYFVLSHAAELTILEPADLRDLIGSLAARIATAHGRSADRREE